MGHPRALDSFVQPVEDFDALLGGWPEDEPVEDFVTAVREEGGDMAKMTETSKPEWEDHSACEDSTVSG